MSAPTRASFAEADSVLRLEFEGAAAASSFVDEALARDGFLVELDRELKQHQVVSVRIVAGGVEPEVEIRAEVAQRFDSPHGGIPTAFLLRDGDEATRAELRRALAAAAEGGPPRPGPPAESAEAADEEEDAGETRGVSVAHRIRTMNPSQKAILAVKAGRSERQVLLRETSPRILAGLLANPRLEGKDVLRLVKSTHATAAILQRIAQDPRWGKNQEILATVAKNPKTPTPLATRLVERLRTSDLRLMAKMSGGMREVIRRAALREYLKRSSSR